MIANSPNINQQGVLLSDHLNQSRLWNRHVELGEIGRTDKGGVNRQALTEEDISARQQVIAWARKLGASPSMDAIGNLFLRYPGNNPELPAVMVGSHLDSQPAGGLFDGTYGVLAGLEVFEAMTSRGLQPQRPVDLVIWLNEEGCRFAPSTMGSGVYSGVLQLDEVLRSHDSNGITVGDALDTMRSTLDLPERDNSQSIHSYVEAHIEHGPILEDRKANIGVVTGIQGMCQYIVTVEGRAAHAGTTPRSKRKDSMAAAVKLISQIEDYSNDPDDLVRFTVGQMEVLPNSINTVAEKVIFTIDLRHPSDVRLKAIEQAIEDYAIAINECNVKIQRLICVPNTQFDKTLIEEIEVISQQLGFLSLRLTSGATHDARSMASLCPTVMIFIPCRDGISHNENEWADPEHLWEGACVLANLIQKLTCDDYSSRSDSCLES